MISLKSLGIEYKAGSVIGLSALVLSLLIGLLSGNEFLYSVGRAFFFGVLFALMGFGGVLLLKKYVPEVLQLAESDSAMKPVDTSENVEVVADNAAASGTGGFVSSAPVNEPAKVEETADTVPGQKGNAPQFEPLGAYYKKETASDALSSDDLGETAKMG
ncbi:MAG TPA: hypothetical protein PKK43_05885, partial [Spirochaetota bacterium]|nr:hypothetical protein [Spirochaetota bacterium]